MRNNGSMRSPKDRDLMISIPGWGLVALQFAELEAPGVGFLIIASRNVDN